VVDVVVIEISFEYSCVGNLVRDLEVFGYHESKFDACQGDLLEKLAIQIALNIDLSQS